MIPMTAKLREQLGLPPLREEPAPKPPFRCFLISCDIEGYVSIPYDDFRTAADHLLSIRSAGKCSGHHRIEVIKDRRRAINYARRIAT